MKSRFFAGLLALALAVGLSVPALAAEVDVASKFPAVNAYPGFADVADSNWYADTVKLCYEVGLMKGTDGGFNPAGTMTIAETVVIAARIHDILNGGDGVVENPAGAESWYTGAVTYIQRLNQLQGNDQIARVLDFPDSPAPRLAFLKLLALVTPADLLAPINSITALPDTSDADVLLFYNAGILTGVDIYGTFDSEGVVSRAECAAMAARLVRPALRRAFTPAEAPGSQADPATAQTPFEQTLLDITDYGYTESDLQALCAYAGLEADDVMIQIEGFPDITAKFYVGLLLDFCLRMDSKALEEGYEDPWNLSWTMDGVSLDGSAHCKRLVLNMCVKTAMFMENSNTSLDAQSLRAFRDSHTVTETQLVQALDVEAFYKAFLRS